MIRVCPGDKLNQWEQYREAWYLLENRAPCPHRKRGRVDLYGIVEDYVAPPKLRTPVPIAAPRRENQPEAALAYGLVSPAPRPGLNYHEITRSVSGDSAAAQLFHVKGPRGHTSQVARKVPLKQPA
jgi:hypothetical protein